MRINVCRLISHFVLAICIGLAAGCATTTPLIEASKEGDTAAVQALLREGADVNAKGEHGMTALMFAAYSGHDVTVQALMKGGADVKLRTRESFTSLDWAIQGGHPEIVNRLLDNGAEVNASDYEGETPLMMAVRAGHINIINSLIKAGADINAKDNAGWTALIAGANKGQTTAVSILLEAGADVDVKPKDSWTALIWAAADGHPAIVQALIKAGADVNAKDDQGQTALIEAANEGHTAAVESLLEGGADVKAQDRQGTTALIRAAYNAQASAVLALLDAGADPNEKSNAGYTALMAAANQGHTGVFQLLTIGSLAREESSDSSKLASLHGTMITDMPEGLGVPARILVTKIWAKGNNVRSEITSNKQKVITIQLGDTMYTFEEGSRTGVKEHMGAGLAAMGLIKQIEQVKAKGKKIDSREIEGVLYDKYVYGENYPQAMAVVFLSAKTSLPRKWVSIIKIDEKNTSTVKSYYRGMKAIVEISDEMFTLPPKVKFSE